MYVSEFDTGFPAGVTVAVLRSLNCLGLLTFAGVQRQLVTGFCPLFQASRVRVNEASLLAILNGFSS